MIRSYQSSLFWHESHRDMAKSALFAFESKEGALPSSLMVWSRCDL